MNSKNTSSKRKGESDLVGAFRELAEAIGELPPENVPPRLLRAARRVFHELDEAGILTGGEGAESEQETLGTSWQREDAGLSTRTRKPERHDKKRKIPGYAYSEGMLYRDVATPEATPELASMAASLIANIALGVKAPFGEDGELRPLLARLGSHREWLGDGEWLAAHAEQVRAAYVGFFRHEYGAKWVVELKELLTLNAYHRKADELRNLNSDELPTWLAEMSDQFGDEVTGPGFGVRTPEQIHATLLERELAIPPELTVEAIRALDSRVGLNPGGRAGAKTADAVVEEFVRGIKVRGNSAG